MKLKDLYLPVGLLLAFILGFIFPREGEYLFRWNFHSIKLSQIIIFMIFAISGYQLKLEDFKLNQHLLYSLFSGITINLILAPCLALLILIILPMDNALRIGLLTIACVPTTMASGIVTTNIAKGNLAWAIIFTIVINAIGIIVIPFTYRHTVEINSIGGIDSIEIFKTLFILVLVPAVIGFLIKKKFGGSKHFLLVYFQPTAIIFIAFCTIAAGKDQFYKLNGLTILKLLIAVITLHLLLFFICILFGKLKKLKNDELIALTFVSSQKTLPLALTLLLIFPVEIASLASISCLLYHLSQVFIDSFVAIYWQRKYATEDPSN